MRFTKTMIRTIMIILLLKFAEMANISEKNKVHTRMRLSRNSRSNAKAQGISTIIKISLKFLSYFVKGYIDSKIINRYKSLKSHLEAADEKAESTQLFINKFNGEKCTFYNRFGILHKSTHFFFKFHKFKNAILNFSLFMDKKITVNSINTIAIPQEGSEPVSTSQKGISGKTNTQKVRTFLQVIEKVQKKRKSVMRKFKNKEGPEEKRKKIKEAIELKKKSLQDKLKKMEEKLEAKLPVYQEKLKKAFDSIEEGLNNIQEKTENLISLYCTAHSKNLSNDIQNIRATIKKEIEDISKKIEDHLKDSNFFTKALQVGLFTIVKNKIKSLIGKKSEDEKEEENEKDETSTEKKSKLLKEFETLDEFVGKVDTIVGDIAGDYTKFPAELMFEGTELFGKFEDLEIKDVVSILEGKPVPEQFKGLSRELIESTIRKGEVQLYITSENVDSVGEWVGHAGAFTGVVVSIFKITKTLKPDADDFARFKHKMTIFNGFFGRVVNVLGKLEKFSPVFAHASSSHTVGDMVKKYLEYRNVVQYVEKKIGFVNSLTTQLRMKTLKYMAIEVQNRCDLLMNSYDILNKNKKIFVNLFSDSKATNLQMYFDLKHKITKYKQENANNLSDNFKSQLEELEKIENDFLVRVMESNSLITASASDLITANTAYFFKSEEFEKIKATKAFQKRSIYGSFNKLLVATSPEEYKSLMEVGYELIYHLDESWAEKYNDFSKFNFLMGCRGCGDEIVSYLSVFSFKKFNALKDNILEAIKNGSTDVKINYLTYDQNVIVYSTYKKELIRFENPLKEGEYCFRETILFRKAFKGVLNFPETGMKKYHIDLAKQKEEQAHYVQTLSSLSNIYCQETSYSHDYVTKVENHQTMTELLLDENMKEKILTKLSDNHKQYVLTYEIKRTKSPSDNQYFNSLRKENPKWLQIANEEKLLLSCTKRLDHMVCYYLKPIPVEGVDEFLRKNIPSEVRSLSEEKYYTLSLIKEKNLNFFGKTFVPITHFFNDDFRREYLRFSDVDLKNFNENFNLGEDSELIQVKYQKSEDDGSFYYDYFIMYDKEKVINRSENNQTQLSPNSESSDKAKSFTDAVENLKNSVCGDKLCNHFFSDGNKRERYVGLSKELNIYNSLYNDNASKLSELSQTSNIPFQEKFDIYTRTENDEIILSQIDFKDPKKIDKNFLNLVNVMIKKTFRGYFLDLETDRNLVAVENGVRLAYRKKTKIMIPPLIKIFGNDHNIFVKIFNFLTLNPESNNKELTIPDLEEFQTTFNDACFASVGNSHVPPEMFLNNGGFLPASIYGRSAISPFFSLILGGKKIDENGKEDDLFQIDNQTKLNTHPLSKWDLTKYCTFQTLNKKITPICDVFSKYPNFLRFFNTFLSTGQDFQLASQLKIMHQNTKEKTLISLSSHFANPEMKESFFDKCGYVIINIPMVFEQKRGTDAKANYYFHVNYDFDPDIQKEFNKTYFEFYMNDKPGFNDLAFIQIIFNKTPKEKMNTFLQYNDSIASLFGYSYVKNKKIKELKASNVFDEMDFDDYSFPIMSKKLKKKLGFPDAMFKAKIVKMKDLSISYKREDICGNQ